MGCIPQGDICKRARGWHSTPCNVWIYLLDTVNESSKILLLERAFLQSCNQWQATHILLKELSDFNCNNLQSFQVLIICFVLAESIVRESSKSALCHYIPSEDSDPSSHRSADVNLRQVVAQLIVKHILLWQEQIIL
jgi:hypothetical protein